MRAGDREPGTFHVQAESAAAAKEVNKGQFPHGVVSLLHGKRDTITRHSDRYVRAPCFQDSPRWYFSDLRFWQAGLGKSQHPQRRIRLHWWRRYPYSPLRRLFQRYVRVPF